ncbi:hypothetical protein UA38_20485 [Photobacterium kishitanii]|uniref:Type 1 fimbrial protein n=1 Tax=Photobacterium kishitanii TaxID=318456 RepID=A0AAX0YZZ0_9GAMM|nr:hypothetical protein [Photobacterium kishitanii]KJG55309.1 hypothetical protein UA38_20485 [Photobacterium kishitanii]KJG58423.1 hypothetical protein UA42_19890 [Photobacterium kishitanii]KJG63864.1 hypothetical protein UA40_19895 [Photobacterium kishitanii]KJG67354.1 hypothetical protein UA41_19470 [Photobacterium kishitanii]PSU14950.1 hypothetical protein CTM84_20775 [Photobacterium kishitanii]
MKKLVLLTMLFSSSFSYAGILTFSGSITAPPCKVEMEKTQRISYKNTTNCVPIMKITEKNIYKKSTKDIKGKIITVSYI